MWVTNLDQWIGSSRDHGDCLDRFDQDRAARKPEGLVRERFVISRVILRQILGALLRVRPADLRFEIDTHGKPALMDPHRSQCFNLSHSGAALLIGTSMSAHVGVDVEVSRSVPKALQLSKRVFTAGERLLLTQASEISEAERDEAFMRIWTRKEAYLKCRGEGFTTPARNYAVGLQGTTLLDGIEVRSVDLPFPGYAALASATPVHHVHRYQLCRDDTI